MACCMAERYGWCKNFKETIEVDGKEYCIFHAPAAEKHRFKKSMQEETEHRIKLLYSIPSYCKHNGWTFDETIHGFNFSGTIFTEKINSELFYKMFVDYVDQTPTEKELEGPSGISLGRVPDLESIIEAQRKKENFILPKINFSHAEFNEDVDFSNTEFENEINFSECTFNAKVDFSSSTFSFKHKLDFSNSFFLGETYFKSVVANVVNFMNCTFKKTSFKRANFESVNFLASKFLDEELRKDFSEVTFNGEVYFVSCTFYGKILFNKCTFNSIAFFGEDEVFGQGAVFYGDTYFTKAKFLDLAKFNSCKFLGKLYFGRSAFSNVAFFHNCVFSEKHSSNFAMSTFENLAVFNNSRFGSLDISLAHFKGPSDFSEINVSNNFLLRKVIFEKNTTFNDSEFGNEFDITDSYLQGWGLFRDVSFGGLALFKDVICEKTILIERTDISKMPFSKINIESFQFIECRWKVINNHASIYDSLNPHKGITPLTLEEIYRRLKNNARKNSDEVQTSNWHYKEKEMQRITANKTKISPSLLTVSIVTIATIIAFALYYFTVPKFWVFPPLFVLVFTCANRIMMT